LNLKAKQQRKTDQLKVAIEMERGSEFANVENEEGKIDYLSSFLSSSLSFMKLWSNKSYLSVYTSSWMGKNNYIPVEIPFISSESCSYIVKSLNENILSISPNLTESLLIEAIKEAKSKPFVRPCIYFDQKNEHEVMQWRYIIRWLAYEYNHNINEKKSDIKTPETNCETDTDLNVDVNEYKQMEGTERNINILNKNNNLAIPTFTQCSSPSNILEFSSINNPSLNSLINGVCVDNINTPAFRSVALSPYTPWVKQMFHLLEGYYGLVEEMVCSILFFFSLSFLF
jgi:hypothetical protein